MSYSTGNGNHQPKYFGLRTPILPENAFLSERYAIIGVVTTDPGKDQVTPFPWDSFTGRPNTGIYEGQNLSYTIRSSNIKSPVPLDEALQNGLTPENDHGITIPRVLVITEGRSGKVVPLYILEATVNSMTHR